MIQKKITSFLLILIFAIINVNSGYASNAISSPANSPSEVISAINNYRQQNGLHSLSTNSLLSSLAQGQANYQASTGNITHTGPGGTTPKDRAYAAGYGDGNTIFLSEIIYGGYKQSVNDALTWWQGSSLHNRVMLDSRYVEIGAGVATDGDYTYYTAVLAWVSGSPASSGNGGTSSSGNSNDSQNAPAPAPIVIALATPMEDGSIIHTVLAGQNLSIIADAYDINLIKLIEQNNLTLSSIIYPGDEILIRPADVSTPEPTQTLSSPEPTPTEGKPQIIGTPVSMSSTETPTERIVITFTPEPTSIPVIESDNSSVQWIIILAFIVIFLVVVGSSFIQKRPDRQNEDDLVR